MRRQLHELKCRPIGADVLQRREGTHDSGIAIPAQHPAGIANRHRAKHGSDAPRRIILYRPERMAVRADASKKGIGLGLVVHDYVLQRFHDFLAVLDRQAEVTIEQALPALVDANLLSANVAEFILPLDRDRPFNCHRCLLRRGNQDDPADTNSSCAPQKSYRSRSRALQLRTQSDDSRSRASSRYRS